MISDVRPGMLIKMRHRLWRVEDVSSGILTATPLDDYGNNSKRFLIELEKIEPGEIQMPSTDNIGSPSLQRLFLNAVRLDALHGTAPFISIQRSGVVPNEYQLVPLVMAMRQQPVRMLLADSTGLGKTIEAGLIIKELLARNQARSVLVITPSSLREQWKQQLKDLFYLDFEILSSETSKRLERTIPPGTDPWHYFDRIITSIDYAKSTHIKYQIMSRDWDLIVVDEAHNAAMPHNQTGRKSDMERYKLISEIASKKSKHLLLLTATPHNGYTDSYSSLLQMLSEDLVKHSSGSLEPERARAVHHVCQRTRKDIQEWFGEGKSPFPQREPEELIEVPVILAPDYQKILNKLDEIMELIQHHAALIKKQQPVEWLRLHLHRRALSSPESLRISLKNRIEKLNKLNTISSESDEFQQLETQDDEDLILLSLNDQAAQDSETEEDADRRVDTAMLRIDQQLQKTHFEALYNELKKITPAKDRKLQILIDEVIPKLFKQESDETHPRVIIFTRYKDTLEYLKTNLDKTFGADCKIIEMHADLSLAAREAHFQEFCAADKAVMIATDVISEGVNLQSASCMVINYDIPWNPNRLEQRIGRVDRYGQKSPIVYIRTIFCKNTHDEDVLDLYIRKFASMRNDLGTTPPIFASEETVARIIKNSKRRKASSEYQIGLFDDSEDAAFQSLVDRIKSDSFYGHTDVKVSDVSDRLNQAYKKFGNPQVIQSFIETGLRHYGCSIQNGTTKHYKIGIGNPRLRAPGVSAQLEKVFFDVIHRQDYSDGIILDVGHPLVRRLGSIIREDAMRENEQGARTTAYKVKGMDGTALIGHAMLRAVASTQPKTLLEEVVSFGVLSNIHGFKALSNDECQKILNLPLSAEPINNSEALQRMQRIYSAQEWQTSLEQAKLLTMNKIQEYRVTLKSELIDISRASESWLNGFDDIELVGFDILCLSLIAPEAL